MTRPSVVFHTPAVLSLLAIACAGQSWAAVNDAPSYNSQIRPILAEHCFKCHGTDEKARKGDLRLDDRDDALVKKALVPGNPEESVLFKRILTHDEDEVMPPPKEKKPLTEEQIALLKRWISGGGNYERHWSFIAPKIPKVPEVRTQALEIRNPIDAFVLAKQEEQKITPAKPAAREEWLRRVSFDLTGLPPSLTELDEFLADTSANAFEKVVDRLIASKAYGEQMAIPWLDLARYADTYGRHEDHDCLTWPYRDWVVRAFNANLPYDKFVLWQTAGDMLPNATQDMYLATAFNRLPQQSNEAGSNEEEFRQEIIADRVRTNGIAFLGLSLECARCHDHKYDPVSTRDYYSLAAFLNNIDECGLYTVYTDSVPAPSMFVYEDEDQERRHTEVKLRLTMKDMERTAMLPAARKRFSDWLQTPEAKVAPSQPTVRLEFEDVTADKKLANLANPSSPAETRLKTKLVEGRNGKGLAFRGNDTLSIPKADDWTRTHPFTISFWIKPQKFADRAVVVHHSRAGLDAGSRGYEVLIEDGCISFALCHFWPGNAIRIRTDRVLPLNQFTLVTATYDGSSRASGLHLYFNGLPTPCKIIRDNLYKDITYTNVFMDKDSVGESMLGMGGRKNDRSLNDATVDDFRLYDRELSAVEVRLIPEGGDQTQTPGHEWFDWWRREKDAAWMKATAELTALRDEENDLSMKMREVMVMRELPESRRRETYVLSRGNFEAKAEQVGPDVPASVFPFPEDLPRTRLGYGKWLVDRRNPLTARVYVNRVWQQFFGRGIVVTSEDFGIQGQLPTHPELLDWLATWFMDNGWDVKALCRLIALSGTYRQSSLPSSEQALALDPENRLLGRGPHTRLTAEQLRDNALSVCGLLDARYGGQPVMPYQPAGLWEDAGTQHSYAQSTGADLFRRSLYTFWRRTLPPPAMTVFDAPTREFCKSRRERSSTPLQALVLFNDPQFLESARVLAERLVRQFPTDDAGRVQTAFRLLTSRQVDGPMCGTLVKLLQESRTRFKTDPQAADDVRRKNGAAAVDDSLDAVEVAATTLLTRALQAYDECVAKP